MANAVVTGILILIVGAAVLYIRQEKKKGVRCVGCPAGGSCSAACAHQKSGIARTVSSAGCICGKKKES